MRAAANAQIVIPPDRYTCDRHPVLGPKVHSRSNLLLEPIGEYGLVVRHAPLPVHVDPDRVLAEHARVPVVRVANLWLAMGSESFR